MRVRIRCSNCEQLLLVREEELGKTGRCPACKQVIQLEPPQKRVAGGGGGRPGSADADVASRSGGSNPSGVAAAPATSSGAPTAAAAAATSAAPSAPSPLAAPTEPVINPTSDTETLAVEELEDDVARREIVEVKGTIPVAMTGPTPLGKQRSAALVFLLTLLFPPFAIYWYIVARREVVAHLKEPGTSVGRVILGVLLLVLTAGVGAWIYCCYLMPKRIQQMQSRCGDPRRVSPAVCLLVGAVPVVGLALTVLTLQGALTRHWRWHQERGSDSVTAGLAA